METSRNTTLPPTQIKDFLVNEYFYKSNSFETLRFYLPLKICLNAFEKTHFFFSWLKTLWKNTTHCLRQTWFSHFAPTHWLTYRHMHMEGLDWSLLCLETLQHIYCLIILKNIHSNIHNSSWSISILVLLDMSYEIS